KVHIEAMKDDAIAWWAQPATILSLPPHSAVKITTGAGKSHVMRDAAVGYVQKAECNKRAVFLVSTHKLGNEALEKMPAGVTPALLQSRKSKSVITGEPMCRNPDAVEAAEKI